MVRRTGERLALPLAGIVAVLVPFDVFFRLILFHFYGRGSFLLDTGLLAALAWHSDAALTMPASVGGESFFAFHVAPIFLLSSAISRLLPLGMAQFFAAFEGLGHALLALSVFWLLAEGFAMRRGVALLVALLAAIGFACSGLAIAIALYPHFEMFAAAFLLLFLVALVLDRPRIALLCFVLALLTREDAGLHAAVLLTLLAAVQARRGRKAGRTLAFAASGLVYAGLAMLAQHWAFAGHSSFARVYLGTPPFAHVNLALLRERLMILLAGRPYIVLPAAGAVIWAVWDRSPLVLLGYAACLPWLMLHLLAASALAGAIVGYYAFPFLIAMAWPLLAAKLRGRQARPQAMAFLGLLALGFVPTRFAYNPGRLSLPQAVLHSPSAAQQRATDQAVSRLAAARNALGRLVVDSSVAALLPAGFGRTEVAGWGDAGTADTIVFFQDGYDAARLRPAAAALPQMWRVPGTMLRLATDRNAAHMAPLAEMLAPSSAGP